MGHTPGPWEEHILQRLTCGCIIMRSTSRAGGAYLVHCDLHAAAPDLLAACQASYDLLVSWHPQHPDDYRKKQAVIKRLSEVLK